MWKRFAAVIKKFVPALVVILLLPVVIALLFLPGSFLFVPPEGFSFLWIGWITAGLVVVFWFVSGRGRPKQNDPIAKKLYWIIVGPVLLGLGLFVTLGQPGYLLAGVGVLVLTIAWLNYLRFPMRFWKIVQLNRQQQYAQALELVHGLIQANPNDWKAYQLRSELYVALYQFAQAERDARLVLKLRTSPAAEDYSRLAWILHGEAQYAEAKQTLLTALKIKPKRSLFYQLGIECYQLEQYEEAIRALSEATRSALPLMMENLMAHYYLGCSYERIGQPDQAQVHFQAMHNHRHLLQRSIEVVNSIPDYPEAIQLRNEYADIEKRLGQGVEKK